MAVSSNVKQEILDRLDIATVIGEYVSLSRRGTRFVGLCPFHTEKTPSFNVVPDRQFYYCFGCGEGGDIFNFIMKMENVGFPEALRILAEKAGVDVSTETSDREMRENGLKEAILELNRRVTGTFEHLLLNSPRGSAALRYLADRGFSDEIIRSFRIGYAPADPGWLLRFLLSKGYSPEFLDSSGLFSRKDDKRFAFFRDRIVFPITNHRGEVVGFGGRSLDEHGPKYLNSPETIVFHKRKSLYGLDRSLETIRSEHRFTVVEGYLDVLAMHQMGFADSVAPLGTSLTEEQIRLLKRYASKGNLVYDSDEAGQRAAGKAVVSLEKLGLTSAVVELPDGRDPADMLREGGSERLRESVSGAADGFTYLIRTAEKKHDLSTPQGKEACLDALTPFLQSVDSEIKRESLIGIIADELGVAADSVRKDFQRKPAMNGRAERERAGSGRANANSEEGMTTELFLMIATAVNLEYFSLIRNHIVSDDLLDERARGLYLSMEELFREGRLNMPPVLEEMEDGSLKQLLLRKMTSEEFSINPERIIREAIFKIKVRNLSRKREEIEARLRKSARGDQRETRLLLEEKMMIDDQIQELKVIKDVGHTE